ncbi:MAG: hypothetical protein LBM93_04620 [Oscillospiraceae bacterium]|jgi:hypothetical protein|nr:hypothetical protein [Oscillospiraceae bacterium]
MLKAKKREIPAEELAVALKMSAENAGVSVVAKTLDKDFPVFDVPVNDKVLIYVPKVAGPNGEFADMEDFLMDRFGAHYCIQGKQGQYIRCVDKVELPSYDLDGTCPFCGASKEVWDLTRARFRDIARAKGLDPEAEDTREALKNEYSALCKQQVIGNPTVKVTFPIVVIDTKIDDKTGKHTTTPVIGEDKQLSWRVMWYTCSEKAYTDIWLKSLESFSDENGETPATPVGNFFVLDYTYTPGVNQKPTKRDSVRELKVMGKPMAEKFNQVKPVFDKAAKDWTPTKAAEVVIDNVLYTKEELETACDDYMKDTRAKLAVYEMQGETGSTALVTLGTAAADAVLASFSGTEDVEETGEAPPQVGIGTTETDEEAVA